MDFEKIAKNYILLAFDRKECEELKIKYAQDSIRVIIDNAIKIMDFYEPDLKNEAAISRSIIIKKMHDCFKQ